MATMSRGELAAELSRCEDLLRRWVLKAWVRGTETLKHAEIVESLEARLRDRACRVDGAFDDAGSTLALRRERDEYAAALTAAAAERDAAEARADAAERGRSGGGYELDRLRDENERLKKRAPPSDVEAALADARREKRDGAVALSAANEAWGRKLRRRRTTATSTATSSASATTSRRPPTTATRSGGTSTRSSDRQTTTRNGSAARRATRRRPRTTRAERKRRTRAS